MLQPIDNFALSIPPSSQSQTPPDAQLDAPPEPSMARDRMQLSETKPTLWEEVAIAEGMAGRPVAFSSSEAMEAYIKSVEQGLPQAAYDPKDFLGSLGITNSKAGGRQDALTLEAVRKDKDYRPDDKFLGSKIPQQVFFDLATVYPEFFLALTRLSNPLLESPSRTKAAWAQPFEAKQAAHPTGQTPEERYPKAFSKSKYEFGPDFHAGMSDSDQRYGTHSIAISMGFSEEQAKRIAVMASGVDFNTTPYGKTGPEVFAQMDRHFNLDRKGEDTRLVWAANHLKAAINYGQIGAYDEAEIELGVGLHSLQDTFAHGQLTPSVHAVIGKYPDVVDRNPIALYEATEATVAYLKTYLKALTPANHE